MVFLRVIILLSFSCAQPQGRGTKTDNVPHASSSTLSAEDVPFVGSDNVLQEPHRTTNSSFNIDEEVKNGSFEEGQGDYRDPKIFEESRSKLLGKRSFGPHSRFETPINKLKWVGYFCEETFVPVLQDKNDRTMHDCTVIEVKQDWEQDAAMRYFGHFMEMVPLSISDMIHVITLCGMMNKNRVVMTLTQESEIVRSRSERVPEPSIILPGTLWCGLKDRADRYEFLGEKMELDSCCRAHDNCPSKVGSFETKYGATNYAVGTSSHCLCDLEFFRCLKRVGNKVSDLVGNFFFDVLRMQCIGPSPEDSDNSASFRNFPADDRYLCIVWDQNKKCRYWAKNNNYQYHFKRSQTKLQF